MIALEGRKARVRVGTGALVECRCAHSVDLGWLRAALEVGPVDAEVSLRGNGAGSVWAIFPGPEHEEVVAAEVHVKAERIHLEAGASSLTLKRDGRTSLRARDLSARGSRTARITGGSVRLA